MPIGDPCSPGSGVRAILDVLDEIAGSERVARATATLPRAQQDELREARALQWVPIRLTTAVIDAVAHELGEEPDAFSERVVREGSRRTLGTIYRAAMRFTWDDALVARAPMLYSRMRDVGTMSARMVERGHAEAIVAGWSGMTDRNARSIRASIASLLELAGREGVHVTYELRATGAMFRARWRA